MYREVEYALPQKVCVWVKPTNDDLPKLKERLLNFPRTFSVY